MAGQGRGRLDRIDRMGLDCAYLMSGIGLKEAQRVCNSDVTPGMTS